MPGSSQVGVNAASNERSFAQLLQSLGREAAPELANLGQIVSHQAICRLCHCFGDGAGFDESAGVFGSDDRLQDSVVGIWLSLVALHSSLGLALSF